MPILTVQGLVKRYRDATVVDGVSFTIQPGEIFGLLGPNGAGKTTLISMLCGLYPPTAGTATIAGYDLVADVDQVKRLIGVVPQDLAIYPTLSARENLAFFGSMYGLRGKALKQRIDDALEIVALADKAHQPTGAFSGGMKRRVNIAAGLLHHPRLLFLDEPTVGVDPQSRNHIFDSVLRLHREFGMTIVYTSHYMEEVETLCKRVAIMDGGKLIALDTKEHLLAQLGGGILSLGLSQGGPDIMETLRSLPSIGHIGVSESAQPESAGPVQVRCQTINAERALLEVIPAVLNSGRQLTAVELSAPNLESVFLHLTGKKLRD
jgi:ABC-2 type transport system ATP-binding protein